MKEARAKAMMGMGVDESDISTEGIIGKEKSGATNKKHQASGKLTLMGTKKPDERGKYKTMQKMFQVKKTCCCNTNLFRRCQI